MATDRPPSRRGRGGRYAGAPKSGRGRRLDLSRRLAAALREARLRQGRPDPGARVLPGLDQANFRRSAWRAIAAEAGLARPHAPKDLRHTFASWLLTLTGDLGYVSAQLGHANVTVTAASYARWIPTDGRGTRVALGPGELPVDLLAQLGSDERLRLSRG